VYLTEILKNIDYQYGINPSSEEDLLKIYETDQGNRTGIDMLSDFICKTIGKGYKDKIKRINRSSRKLDFVTGPEDMLEIEYEFKVINEEAIKNKVITKDMVLQEMNTWETILRPGIFKNLIDTSACYNGLTKFQIDEHMPRIKKANNDATFTTYKYVFYQTEKPEWKSPERLQSLSFKNGYIRLKVDMPVKQEAVIPADKEGIKNDIK